MRATSKSRILLEEAGSWAQGPAGGRQSQSDSHFCLGPDLPKSFTLLHSSSPRIINTPGLPSLLPPASPLWVNIRKCVDVPSSHASILWPHVDDGLWGGRIFDKETFNSCEQNLEDLSTLPRAVRGIGQGRWAVIPVKMLLLTLGSKTSFL